MKSGGITDSRRLTPEERDRLLSALGAEGDRIMLRLLLEAGRPLEDLLGARFSDLHLGRGALRLGRGGRRDGRTSGGGLRSGVRGGPPITGASGGDHRLWREESGKKVHLRGKVRKARRPQGGPLRHRASRREAGARRALPREGPKISPAGWGVSRIFAISPGR